MSLNDVIIKSQIIYIYKLYIIYIYIYIYILYSIGRRSKRTSLGLNVTFEIQINSI